MLLTRISIMLALFLYIAQY